MTSFDTFEDALSDAKGQKNLLVGNGLSIAFDEKFGYSQLFDVADFINNNPKVASIFDALKTKDFETVVGALYSASEIARNFEEHAFSKKIIDHISVLKTALIEAVRHIHPGSSNLVSADQAAKLRSFMQPFLMENGCIFSLNYDALIYWSLLKDGTPKLNFADGFSTKEGAELKFAGDGCPKEINVLFPHGTLFIFDKNGDAFKPKAKDKTLIEIITEHMGNGDFPLFVSEGSSEQKLMAIRKSFYLNYAYEKIERQKDNFFTFGHSLDLQSDGHIFRKIAENKNVSNLYASYYDSEEALLGNLHHLLDAAKRDSTNPLNIHTFPAKSVSCW
ncbi:DUF4917 family protein [Agrobacterium vitis]|uniref:DUF4917 family protein n=1 Tax=Agrobacterium vitis TaxID=373 RepID=UPI0015DB135B|nr:DUF4917 family protein [Agrobacterium vitis]MCF1454830.1 DUF4917 family protein [Agrobacterium vitis]BCH54766.1 DUF4917 domain-containing protein [Agrobacterium vitis]